MNFSTPISHCAFPQNPCTDDAAAQDNSTPLLQNNNKAQPDSPVNAPSQDDDTAYCDRVFRELFFTAKSAAQAQSIEHFDQLFNEKKSSVDEKKYPYALHDLLNLTIDECLASSNNDLLPEIFKFIKDKFPEKNIFSALTLHNAIIKNDQESAKTIATHLHEDSIFNLTNVDYLNPILQFANENTLNGIAKIVNDRIHYLHNTYSYCQPMTKALFTENSQRHSDDLFVDQTKNNNSFDDTNTPPQQGIGIHHPSNPIAEDIISTEPRSEMQSEGTQVEPQKNLNASSAAEMDKTNFEKLRPQFSQIREQGLLSFLAAAINWWLNPATWVTWYRLR